MTKEKNVVLILIISTIVLFFASCSSNNEIKVNKSKENLNTETTTETDESNADKSEGLKDTSDTVTTKDSTNNAGVILGFSKPEGLRDYSSEYKTIWISKIDGEVSHKIKSDVIIAPHGNEFYQMKNMDFSMWKLGDWAEKNQTDYSISSYEYKLTYNTIGAAKIGETIAPQYTEEFMQKQIPKLDWPIQEVNEKVIYVGNEYITIVGDKFETGGGTYRSGYYYTKIHKISDFNKESNELKLFDLLKIKDTKEYAEYNEKYNKVLKDEKVNNETFYKETQKMDWDNIVLGRENGVWVAQVPVVVETGHYGNGSNFIYPTEYLTINTELPSDLVLNNSLSLKWSEIIKVLPDAIDAVSSNESELLIILTKDKVLVYKDNNTDLSKPDLSIDNDGYDKIISEQWSYGKYVDSWDKVINK